MSETVAILQPEDWGGEMGARWLAAIDDFEAMARPAGAALLARAAYVEGERVVDVGCGGGATSLAIASAVGRSGAVVGIDISRDLTAKAQERAAEAGTLNVRFVCADASCYTPETPFDRLFSRFGSMFFADPHAAFTHLHGCLRPGGRIDLAVWGPPRENPWMMEMMSVLRRHIEVAPASPRAPGPFAFADVGYLTAILEGSGFTDLDISPFSTLQVIGGTGSGPEEAVRFAVSSLAAGRLLEGRPEALRRRVEADLLTLFAQHHRPQEGVLMTGKAWLVSAIA